MKKTLLILFTLLIVGFSQAQEGCIVYTDFQPDLSIAGYHDTLYVDLDQDGTVDFEMFIDILYSTMVQEVFITTLSPSWYFRTCQNPDYSFVWSGPDEYDTIVPYPHWGDSSSLWQLYWDTSHQYLFLGFRKVVEDQNYYAWAKIHMYQADNTAHVNFEKMAYCTIPNYPLAWGQTSLNDEVDESITSSFATIHPNPNNGLFSIVGKDLQSVTVTNVIGQQVTTFRDGGDLITIDLSDQPAGVYLITVTDTEGRKCVRKAVKQ